jgi:DNA-binding response OmpR family regulator
MAPLNSCSSSLRSVVVVDPSFEAYRDLVAGSREGRLDLHIRTSGSDALRLADKIHVDAWIVVADLDDMAGPDFLALLRDKVGASVPMVTTGPTSDAQTTVGGQVQVLAGPVTCDALEALIDEAAWTPIANAGLLAKLFAVQATGIGIATSLIVVALQAG